MENQLTQSGGTVPAVVSDALFDSFEAYWAARGIVTQPAAIGLLYRDVAGKAWNAAIQAADSVCWTKRDKWDEGNGYSPTKGAAAEEIGRAVRNLSVSNAGDEPHRGSPKPTE